MGVNVKDMMPGLFGGKTKRKKMRLGDAREILVQEEAEKLVDQQNVAREAIDRVEQSGIVFLDEIDKIAGRQNAGTRPRRLPRRRAARSAADRRRNHGQHEVRHGEDRPHPLHRRRRVPRLQAVRSHPRAAGPLPHPRRARVAHRRRFRAHPARAEERADDAVHRAARDRRRDADVRRRRGRQRSRATPRSSTRRRRTSAHADCTRFSSDCSTSCRSTRAI